MAERGEILGKLAAEIAVGAMMDLEPRNAETRAFAGRVVDDYPVIGAMLTRAMAEDKPIASDPLNLLRPDGPVGVVLAAQNKFHRWSA